MTAAKRLPFHLMIDPGRPGGPRRRYFSRLDRAVEAWELLEPRWRQHAWITEFGENGGRVTHVRAGRVVSAAAKEAKEANKAKAVAK